MATEFTVMLILREKIFGKEEISKQHSTKVIFTVGTLRNNLQSVNKLTDEC